MSDLRHFDQIAADLDKAREEKNAAEIKVTRLETEMRTLHNATAKRLGLPLTPTE